VSGEIEQLAGSNEVKAKLRLHQKQNERLNG
jgi:hypothetical protein